MYMCARECVNLIEVSLLNIECLSVALHFEVGFLAEHGA